MKFFAEATCVLLLTALCFSSAQNPIANSPKGASEDVEAAAAFYYGAQNEVLSKVQDKLANTLEMLQEYQAGMPLKLAQKRRNKFEFIRFGRR